MEVYLIVRCWGEYEEYSDEIIFATLDKDFAEAYQAKANKLLPKLYSFYSDKLSEVNKLEWNEDTSNLWNFYYDKKEKFDGAIYIWETDMREPITINKSI